MKRYIRKVLLGVIMMCSVFLLGSAEASAKKSNEWFTTKIGTVRYYNKQGKISTGKVKIGNHDYCFDAKGRQLVGWQCIKGEYYFFRIQNGKKAWMVTDTTVNGIKINANGKADRRSGVNARKLRVMAAANKILEKLTNCKQTYSKREKLRLCFDYTVKTYFCCNIGSFRQTSTWDLDYAERVIIPTDPRYRADCYTYGCAMAYLANACGAKAACISDTGHGWCEVDGYVCDPNWSMVDHTQTYFMRSLNLFGPNAPAYKYNRFVVKPI